MKILLCINSHEQVTGSAAGSKFSWKWKKRKVVGLPINCKVSRTQMDKSSVTSHPNLLNDKTNILGCLVTCSLVFYCQTLLCKLCDDPPGDGPSTVRGTVWFLFSFFWTSESHLSQHLFFGLVIQNRRATYFPSRSVSLSFFFQYVGNLDIFILKRLSKAQDSLVLFSCQANPLESWSHSWGPSFARYCEIGRAEVRNSTSVGPRRIFSYPEALGSLEPLIYNQLLSA